MVSLEDAQTAINKAVKIATRSAMRGYPVRSILWVPPLSAPGDPGGSFVVHSEPQLSASILPSWER